VAQRTLLTYKARPATKTEMPAPNGIRHFFGGLGDKVHTDLVRTGRANVKNESD